MSAREEVLDRVRRALADRPEPAPAIRRYRRAGSSERGTEALLQQLAERLVDYRAVVHRASQATVADVVAAALAARAAHRVVVPAGLPEGWLGAAAVERVADDPTLTTHALDALDGVITGCTVAVAETGTIVLDGAAGQGRRALSLVPDFHLVVVRAEQVVAGVPDAIARLDPARPATWISGPSATSDIELVRVEGVHGPRTLEVVLLS